MRTDNPEFWNMLFDQEAYAFGEESNHYLKEKLTDMTPGKVLLPGEGEGRNAVYCALQGWGVSAFDISEKGKEKADRLAADKGVKIDFKVGDVPEILYPEEYFDALVLIFAHFMPQYRRSYHRQLMSYLKPGGKLILEGHARSNEEAVDIRFNLEELREDFKGLAFIEAQTGMEDLHEGRIITGATHVVQIFAQK